MLTIMPIDRSNYTILNPKGEAVGINISIFCYKNELSSSNSHGIMIPINKK